MAKGLSPMMAQYFEIKSQYPGALLFFRLGDFYEMFFDDAKIASEELDLVLTGKDCGQEERAPMCGVPFHSADNYIAKLVSRGYKVAICEQIEDPKLVKGLVKRDVIRIITPGTVIESNMLDDTVNNYLCSICKGEKETGLCFADVSTCEFHITVVSGEDVEEQIVNQLSTYQPKEIIVNSAALDFNEVAKFTRARLSAELQLLDDNKYDFDEAANLILETLKKDEIDSLNLGHSKTAVSALGAVIDYLKEVQKKDEIEAPADIDFFDKEEFMKLDIREKKVLYVYGCPDYYNTVTRLKWLVSLTVDQEAKRWLLALARKMETEGSKDWHSCFYHHLRMEMGGYFRAKKFMKAVESSTNREEDMYEEAV